MEIIFRAGLISRAAAQRKRELELGGLGRRHPARNYG